MYSLKNFLGEGDVPNQSTPAKVGEGEGHMTPELPILVRTYLNIKINIRLFVL